MQGRTRRGGGPKLTKYQKQRIMGRPKIKTNKSNLLRPPGPGDKKKRFRTPQKADVPPIDKGGSPNQKFKDEQKIKLFNELINDPETVELMGINPELQRIAALASKVNAQRNLIVSDKKMDGETKRFKIDQLEKQMLIYFEETMKVIKKLDLIVKQPLIKVPTIFK